LRSWSYHGGCPKDPKVAIIPGKMMGYSGIQRC
jgi:hypothetical protein